MKLIENRLNYFNVGSILCKLNRWNPLYKV